ncbi:MAG: acyl-CoA dehydrogenase C-terminal domain-containing protein [Candidatus Thalassarchaeaceae archaeon]|jgi:alkylation response protein AidB-like acyl-CoA dehydrogenase|nr:acyl-CoA dehydrogenase [Euryarchaeota archaeon]MBV43354.1 acyl-CoA dehydrogenase [Euryarchaeota archaeon]MDP7445961.1 acyl-CoA dehydrogenase C-terminal domain-containing protein [Candidatus Thalassarchaeaceae archaeon]MDP7648935.1 acyl-CoA dehydrogenase C-terminal domain-containing protein [Candidatus Thalassarchaeaceae archaeon]HJO85293.1 acyl-CoA dehydrogenase C-terminal domain-containing protein [Candidatus Thalassarchaeaceae archaeon]
MVEYNAPIRDYEFLYNEVLDAIPTAQRLGFVDFDAEFLSMLMEGWAEHTTEVWLPINQLGDIEGLKFEDGTIKMPQEFKDAYREGIEGGWMSTSCKPEHGGMGVPVFFQSVTWAEFGTAANMAMSVLPALSVGVYEVLTEHGDQELIDYFATNLASGEWSGTMCLTEPHAGTDLGIITTKAEPQEDGTYRVSGTKTFITYGEHDMTDNIVHLVLAKTPGAPESTKGITLFLVPKFLPAEWESGGVEALSQELMATHNGVTCSGSEEKMGLHASPTCVMNFDESIGWRVGELHEGMSLMFQMMNRERVATGMMGIGLAEIAYQNALAWARERRQGRDLKGMQDPNERADNILVHPDVRRMLLEAKVNNEGCRALAAWTGLLLDQMSSEDPEEAEYANALISLFTPIVKAHFTDLGCETASTCMQVMGGAGYCSEFGVEQFYRDVRISRIWEGTNGIQALDLTGRKITQNMGKNLRHLMWPLTEFIEENRDIPEMSEFNKPLHQGVRGLQHLTLLLIAEGQANPHFLAAGATDYCRYFGNILLAYMWARMARVALESVGDPFYDAKIASARFFFKRIFPETVGLAAKIQAGHKPMMEYPEAMM